MSTKKWTGDYWLECITLLGFKGQAGFIWDQPVANFLNDKHISDLNKWATNLIADADTEHDRHYRG